MNIECKVSDFMWQTRCCDNEYVWKYLVGLGSGHTMLRYIDKFACFRIAHVTAIEHMQLYSEREDFWFWAKPERWFSRWLEENR